MRRCEAPKRLVSIFTPANNSQFLPAVYQSLAEQTSEEWEWVILLNNEAFDSDLSFVAADDRVRVVGSNAPLASVGYWKREACRHAEGDILLELDQDDRLLPAAVSLVRRAFDNNPQAGMVYSNAAAVLPDWTPNEDFGEAYGWQYRAREAMGHFVRECRAPAPLPQNLCRIWYAPDHLRAWRTETYWQVGGHDPSLPLADDHDLICRTYLASEILHIDELLYIYFVHGANHSKTRNEEVQALQWAVYFKHVERLALRWAGREKLRTLDLCGGISPREGYETVDLHSADVQCDLDGPWPFEDNSVGVIRGYDALEHLRDPIHAMNEMWRVLAHGGFAFLCTPSTDGRGAYQDPTHRSRWNSNSFWYYTKAAVQQYIRHAGARARFQLLHLENGFPSEFHRLHLITYVTAHLIALKDGPRFHGLVEI